MKHKEDKFNEAQEPLNPEEVAPETPAEELNEAEAEITEEDPAAAEVEIDETEKLREELAKEKKEYLFLMAEFDNFRKRTLKEKSEIIRNAGENVLKGLLPIVDDFERGLKASESSESASDVREGMQLIYNKLVKYLSQNGVKPFDPEDNEFDADKHEAISVVPVPDESLKGKILDTVEKGYMINDKVLRHAKVVVGQ
ncbi:MAG: nucleotide exchange factor GrpE [Muribaculaceae bacterium]|nr:nucleotide exchange factor GrpE [Muribaculaceae bacterium]